MGAGSYDSSLPGAGSAITIYGGLTSSRATPETHEANADTTRTHTKPVAERQQRWGSMATSPADSFIVSDSDSGDDAQQLEYVGPPREVRLKCELNK